MTDADLYRVWSLWLAVGGAVTAVAAALLIAIWRIAGGIEREARRALRAVERIRDATAAIWQLDGTNQVADELLAAARDLEAHGAEIATALGGPGAARRTPA